MNQNRNELVDTFVQVKLKSPDDFLKVKETLTRMGTGSNKDKVLFQACHILHKAGKYYICHYEELHALDGRSGGFKEQDKSRRNAIAKLLEDWGLVTIVNPEIIGDDIAPINKIMIISYKDRDDYDLVAKYLIGRDGRR